MPKLIEYPRASFIKALEVAKAVDSLGGECSADTCADKMNYSGGSKNGAFAALVGAAVKHQLITSKASLSTSELYRNINLAYDEDERMEHLKISFLNPPLYRKIYERFKGKELPMSILEKMLVRDYEVDRNMASRVGGYIVEGAKFVSLLVDNKLMENVKTEEVEVLPEKVNVHDSSNERNQKGELTPYQEIPIHSPHNEDRQGFNADGYIIHIVGPDTDSKYKLADEDDFVIIEATLRKLRRKLGVT